MFDTKFELDSRFGDTTPPHPKRKKERGGQGGRTSRGCIDA